MSNRTMIDEALTSTRDALRDVASRAKHAVADTLGLNTEDPSHAHRLREMLSDFDTAMFVSNLSAVPTGRPMTIVDFDGTAMWFVTDDQSPKALEVAHDGSALVTLQSRTAYAMVRGEAELVHDPAKLEALWSPAMQLWWPDGPDERGMVFIRFVPMSGQYWNLGGTNGLRFVKNVAKAKLTGTPVQPVPGAQGQAVL